MIEVPLTRDKIAMIDDEDAEMVLCHKWTAKWTGQRWYAFRSAGGRKNLKTIYLHRMLMDASPGQRIDHINNDGLDCSRANMRVCTISQNGANCGPRVRNRSGYKGVGWSSKERKWIASIQCKGVKFRLGCFSDPVAAAKVYDAKAIELFGEFAQTNFNR